MIFFEFSVYYSMTGHKEGMRIDDFKNEAVLRNVENGMVSTRCKT